MLVVVSICFDDVRLIVVIVGYVYLIVSRWEVSTGYESLWAQGPSIAIRPCPFFCTGPCRGSFNVFLCFFIEVRTYVYVRTYIRVVGAFCCQVRSRCRDLFNLFQAVSILGVRRIAHVCSRCWGVLLPCPLPMSRFVQSFSGRYYSWCTTYSARTFALLGRSVARSAPDVAICSIFFRPLLFLVYDV